MSNGINEAEIDRSVAAAFGRAVAPDAAWVAAFEAAGFDHDAALQGAKLMESGRFFGFEDVATTLATSFSGQRRNLLVTREKIAEAARRLEAAAGVVSEGAMDALDDAIFGPPGGANVSEAPQKRDRNGWIPIQEAGDPLDALDDAVFGAPGSPRNWRR